MDWLNLLKLLPVAVGAVNPVLGMVAKGLEEALSQEVDKRAAAEGKTRDEVIAEATAKWEKNIKDAQDLGKLGHEGG